MPQPTTSKAEQFRTRCCVAGGGPAGMLLGYLLARSGVEVVVLEKHADFLRDFRGDTIHPSTLEVMHELGLLHDLLRLPHQEARQLRGHVGDTEFTFADFSHVPTRCKFVAFMPQWDFLEFLADRAGRYPTFHLRLQAEVTELLHDGGRIAGVRATTPDGPLEVRADLTVGADGRHSTVRARAGLEVIDLGAPIDVLWLRLPWRPGDPKEPQGRFDRGRLLAMIYRGDYWQCGFVIPKGGYDEVRRRGLDAFREEVAAIAPPLRDRVGELKSWDDVKLLTVRVDRLRRWYRPGLLCLGDAAHAMSPVGGVGINIAIQDTVAAANLLAARLRVGPVTVGDLAQVQQRREFPTRWTQRLQLFVQDRVIGRVLRAREKLTPPWPVRLLARWPILQRIPARLIGVGFRSEHVHTRDAFGPAPARASGGARSPLIAPSPVLRSPGG
jgi:2-polyprenyl-6-methoxyphenol hydroxylase-like FAD-dependent oxidoreductase